MVESYETLHHYSVVKGRIGMMSNKLKHRAKVQEWGACNTRMPRRWTASAQMVPAERDNHHNILSVGEGSPVEYSQKRCGDSLSNIFVTFRTTAVARRSATYLYTQHRKRKHRFVSGNESRTAADFGGDAE